MSEYIEHDGSGMPDDIYNNTMVDVIFKNGMRGLSIEASFVVWENTYSYRKSNDNMGESSPEHYNNYYTRALSTQDKKNGFIKIKLDPYRICDVLNIGGGAREQIVKKGLRWTTKGDDERKVINEIKQACDRRLEMLDEDGK